MIRPFVGVRFPASDKIALADDFATNGKPIRTIIWSHGLSSNQAFYSGLLQAFAAQGYLVIALNHQDGSCLFTKDRNGTALDFDTSKDKIGRGGTL